jgi:hypothetical protein
MDLGGVDVAGSRSEPHEAIRCGLYQHKVVRRAVVEPTGAHERVFDPNGYRIGRLAGRAATGRVTRRRSSTLAAADLSEPMSRRADRAPDAEAASVVPTRRQGDRSGRPRGDRGICVTNDSKDVGADRCS